MQTVFLYFGVGSFVQKAETKKDWFLTTILVILQTETFGNIMDVVSNYITPSGFGYIEQLLDLNVQAKLTFC